MEMVLDGLTVYVHADMLGSAFGGKEWMKVDMRRTYEEMGLDVGSLRQMGQGTDQLRMLKEVSSDVSEEGHDTVVGVDATHYRVTLDLRKYRGGRPRS
jgi:hypothetical protein